MSERGAYSVAITILLLLAPLRYDGVTTLSILMKVAPQDDIITLYYY